jgi:hypothetical protein
MGERETPCRNVLTGDTPTLLDPAPLPPPLADPQRVPP